MSRWALIAWFGLYGLALIPSVAIPGVVLQVLALVVAILMLAGQ